jgi:hypothetical protein
MNETTYSTNYSTLSTLYLAFELGNKEWKLGFTIGLGQSPRKRKIDAAHSGAVYAGSATCNRWISAAGRATRKLNDEKTGGIMNAPS